MKTNTKKYQEKAHSFAKYGGKFHYPILGLAEEAGEVCGKFAKFERKNHREPEVDLEFAKRTMCMTDSELDADRKFREDLKAELGDVLWMVAEIATRFQMTLDEIMDANIAKLEERVKTNTIVGEGDTITERQSNADVKDDVKVAPGRLEVL